MSSYVWPNEGGGSGTVTSVGLADGSNTPIFSITNSPVTTAGTLTFSLINQNANLIFAGPASGGAAQPSYRALVNADIPSTLSPTMTNLTLSGKLTFSNSSPSEVPQVSWLTSGSTFFSGFCWDGSTISGVYNNTLNFRFNDTAALFNSPLTVGPGNSGQPGIGTTGDSSTGFYWVSSGKWGFTSSGTPEMAIDSTGMSLVHPLAVASGGSGVSTAAQNLFFASPNGSSGAPSFRAIVAADVPTLNQNTTGTAANITASSNSTLTTLSALSLPGSQVTGDISGNAANITASSNTTLTTLSNLVTIGTITGGTWTATKIAEAYGGTNQSTYAKGDILYASAANTLSKLTIGSTNNVLTVSAGGIPSWAPAASSGVTSVGVAVPNSLTVSGSPVTSSGTITIGNTAVNANTGSYALTAMDSCVTFDPSNSAFNATLPTAVGISGTQYCIKNIGTGTGTVAIVTTSAQTLDGRVSGDIVLQSTGDFITVESDGANWVIIAKKETSVVNGVGSSYSISNASTGGYLTSGCSVTLGAGTWRIFGKINLVTGGGSVSAFIDTNSGFYAADGANDGSTPAALATVFGTNVTQTIVGGLNGIAVDSGDVVIVATFTTSTSVYLVPQVSYATAGSSVMQGFITAERIW